MVPRRGAAAIASSTGLITVRAVDDGSVQVDFDGEEVEILLRISEAIELHDGDLVCAGQQWMCYEAGRDGLPHRVHQLDAEGNTRMTLCVRGTTLSVGRTAGDVVIPCDDTMSALHFQVLVRGEAAFVQDLASETGTWVIVRPGEVLPSGSFLAVGDRLLCVSTPPPFEAEPTPPEPSWRTSLYAYAHAAA